MAMSTPRYTPRWGLPLREGSPVDRYATLVAKWAGATFTNPVPLIDRRDLEPGDTVYSSRGRAGVIVRVHKTNSPTSTTITGEPHLNPTVQIWFEDGATEAYEGAMPLLADADGTVYGHRKGYGCES